MLIFHLVFVGCNFSLPEIQIMATPSVRFSVANDLTGTVREIIRSAFGGDDEDIRATVLDGTANETIQTFVIVVGLTNSFEMDIFDQPLDEFGGMTIGQFLDIFEYLPIRTDRYLPLANSRRAFPGVHLPDLPYLPFARIGEHLSGINLNLDALKARLYFFAEHEIIQDINVEIEFSRLDEDGEKLDLDNNVSFLFPTPNAPMEFVKSGINLDNNGVFPYATLPDGGLDVDDFAFLINERMDVGIDLKVFIPGGTRLYHRQLVDNSVFTFSAELVIWLPLQLDIDKDAEITLPLITIFDDDDGFDEFVEQIGSVADTLTSITVGIELTQNNPFNEAILVIQQPSAGLEIVNPLNEPHIKFTLLPGDLDKIARLGRSLNPDIIVRFPYADTIKIPRNMGVSTVSIDAISFRLGLQ